MGTVPYSLSYLDEQENKKSLLPRVGMRDAAPYAPFTVPEIPKLKQVTATSTPKDLIAFNYKQPSGSLDRVIPQSLRTEQLAKAGVFGGTVLGELGLINRIKNRQLARTMAPLNIVQASVAPAQDMPAEILNQRTNQINRLRSTYKGSDAASKLIADQLAAAARTDAADKLAAERGQLLLDERRRVAGEIAANQLRAGDIANQNIERAQQLADYKLEAGINADTQKRKLLSEVGTQLTNNIETAQAYNTRAKLMQKNAKLSAAEMDYQNAAAQKIAAIQAGFDPAKWDPFTNEMNAARERYKKILEQDDAGTYWKRSPWMKNGGKLLPRI